MKIDYLRRMINYIFSIKKVGYNDSDSNNPVVKRGEGKEIGDCSFSELYYSYYKKIFELTFVSDNVSFSYTGKRDNKGEFCRDIAVKNAVEFLGNSFELGGKSLRTIDINYYFYDNAEKRLFSKYIYTILNAILDELFSSEKSDFIQRLNNLFLKEQKKLKKDGIISLIYFNINKSDISTVVDDCVDKAKADTAYCLCLQGFNRFEIEKLFVLGNYAFNKIWLSQKYEYPFDEKSFVTEDDDSFYLFNIFDKNTRLFFFPAYCMFLTSSEQLREYSNSNEINKYCEEKAFKKIIESLNKESYKSYKKQYARSYYKEIEKILRKMGQINYTRFFNFDFNTIRDFYKRFKEYADKVNIDKSIQDIMFVYLITASVEKLCKNLISLLSDQSFYDGLSKTYILLYFNILIDKESDEYLHLLKEIANIAKNGWVDRAKVEFDLYYEKNYNEIVKVREYVVEKTGFQSMNNVEYIFMDADIEALGCKASSNNKDSVKDTNNYCNNDSLEESKCNNSPIKEEDIIDPSIPFKKYNPYKWLKDILLIIKNVYEQKMKETDK